MGFDRATIQFLLNAKSAGLSLDRILTIGRQKMYIEADQLQSLLSGSGMPLSLQEAQSLLQQEDGFCEPFLRQIGAREIDSIDISSYENATVVHDMNLPLGERYFGQYSVVVDGGSIEHVFHFPTALSNCMQAVRLGGHFITITPANNMMGHGFYQFSPELMFRVLGPSNGFELTNMILYEQPWDGAWYAVKDPEDVKSRVTLRNSQPTYLIACAKRRAIVPLFADTPQQSDYAELWRQFNESGASPWTTLRGWKRLVPQALIRAAQRLQPHFPRRIYSKLPSRF